MKRLLVASAAVLALAACGDDPWEGEGVVTEKGYDDPDTWYQPGYTIPGSCSGNPPTCTAGISMPGIWHSDPERFILFVMPTGEDSNQSVVVPQSLWESCEVGQGYSTTTQECKDR
jgi:hypothetical protein